MWNPQHNLKHTPIRPYTPRKRLSALLSRLHLPVLRLCSGRRSSQSRRVAFTVASSIITKSPVGICWSAIAIKIVFHAQHNVRGFWVFGCYCDWVGVGPVAAFRCSLQLRITHEIWQIRFLVPARCNDNISALHVLFVYILISAHSWFSPKFSSINLLQAAKTSSIAAKASSASPLLKISDAGLSSAS